MATIDSAPTPESGGAWSRALGPEPQEPHAHAPLAAVKQFMSDINAVIMMVVLLLLGAKLIGDGLAHL